MRPLSILTTALLLTAGLSAVATPATAPGPSALDAPCQDQDLFNQFPVRVTQHRDCTHDIALFEDIICVGGWGDSVSGNIGGNQVTAYYCDGDLGNRIRDLVAPPALAGPTSAPCNDAGVSGVPGVLTAHVSDSCHVTLTVNEGVNCLGGSSQRHDVKAGAATVVAFTCPPSSPPAVSSSTSASPDCPPINQKTPFGSVIVHEDCSAIVPTPGNSCPHFHVDTVFGPVVLRSDCSVGVPSPTG
jgi:hypothetical protein